MANSSVMDKVTNMSRMDRTLMPAILMLVVVFFVFESSDIDVLLQDRFYDFHHQAWLVNAKSFWPRLLFYTGAKTLLKLLAALLILSVLSQRFMSVVWRNRFRKRDLCVVLATMAIAPSLVAWSKAVTNVHCPYQLQRYDGKIPYLKLLERFPPDQKPNQIGRGFPAGHASGGFALVSLAGLATTGRGRWTGVALGVVLGTTMGVYQMLKGAHFLSHTLVTALFCWIVFLTLRRVFGVAGTDTHSFAQLKIF